MSENDFYCAIKIDCEATKHAVRDSQLGSRASISFANIVEAEGLLGTFFVIPTDLEASPNLYRELDEKGHEVGLHLHPAEQGYEEFLGIYGPDDQRKIIKEAADRFAQVMGYRPRSFCPGYYSANDYTYSILSELGFTHVNNSMPMRILPECASVWAGAPLDIHYANPYNRIMTGSLDLVNIPCTNDPDSRMWGGKHPQDLRVELVDAKNHWYTIAKAVNRQMCDRVPVKYILMSTHNTYDYGDPHNFRRETLEKMINHARHIAASKGSKLIAATLEQMADIFRKKCPIEQASGPKLTLDTRGES
jgi:peptidoglycan/xylan/chitin deacetylase (PgdA/CDA1 family)